MMQKKPVSREMMEETKHEKLLKEKQPQDLDRPWVSFQEACSILWKLNESAVKESDRWKKKKKIPEWEMKVDVVIYVLSVPQTLSLFLYHNK